MYDGVLIPGMKNTAFRPANYRRNTLRKQGNSSGQLPPVPTPQDELMKSLQRRTKAREENYIANRSSLK